MPGSVASVFSEAEDFETALRQEGYLGLLVIGRGAFRARLTQVVLQRLRLTTSEEKLARIAFIAVPAGTILVTFAIGKASAPIWAGIEQRATEIITIGPGEMVHARTGGPALWGTLRIPERDCLDYGEALTGTRLAVPSGIARWRLRAAAARQLRDLHRAAMRLAEMRSGALADVGAAHGLEQQVIDALIECLADVSAEEEALAAKRHRDILTRFEEALQAGPLRSLPSICAELGISEQLLRKCCGLCLGLSPAEYCRRRAMQQVNRELRRSNAATATVAQIARRQGFKSFGRFAASYRAVYGELPSETLRSPDGFALTSSSRPLRKIS